MKITIDTTNKTVQVNDTVTLDELLCTLESLGIDYVEYKLIQDVQIPSINIPHTYIEPWKPYCTYNTESSIENTQSSTTTCVHM
jgi:hypothetical protein